jgi:hypothetical protein
MTARALNAGGRSMNGSRIPRSVVALALAVVGWAWLHSRLSDPPHVDRPPAALVATTPAQPTAPATHVICGRALDAHGAPTAVATVWLTRHERSDFDLAGSTIVAQTQTGGDGRFALAPLVSAFGQSSETPAEFEVWIWKPGLAVARTSFFGTAPAEPLTVSLLDERPLTIQLRQPDGSPCSDATATPTLIWSTGDRKIKLPQPICERLKTHSAGDGRIQVSGWHRGSVTVALETKEFGVQTARFDIRPHDDTPIVVTLRSTRPFEGRVAPPEGAKADLSRLQVVLRQSSLSPAPESKGKAAPEESPASPLVWLDEYVVRPDRDGHFGILHFPAATRGSLRLHIRGLGALGFADDRDSSCESSDLPADKTLKIDLPARKGVWTTWFARDAHTKRPLAGVRVGLLASNEFRCGGRTDANGCLRVCLAAGETYAIECELPDGYLRTLFGPQAYVEIPGGVTHCEPPPIELVRGCPIEGRAVDAAGRPLADVRIRADWQTRETKAGKKPADVRQWVVTDVGGRFRFEQVEAGANVRLTANRAGILFTQPITMVAGDDKPILLQEPTRELVALSGRVSGTDRKPLVGAQVVVEVADSPDALGQFRTTVETDGSIRTPPQFPRQLKYRLTVRSLLTNVASSAWLCPASSGNRFPDLAVDPSKSSLASKLLGQEVVARVNGQLIFASELLERAAVEPLNADGLNLLSAGNNLARGGIAEEEFRVLQETAIKTFLPGFVRTRLLSQGYCTLMDAEQTRKSEEAIDREFDNYVVKLEGDFQVTSRQGVDEKLRHQGTSLASLKAEFRYRLFADEYLRGIAQHVGPVDRPQLLAYYQAHHDRYAIPEKVTWQLLEVSFDHQRFTSSKTTSHTVGADSWMALYKRIGREAGVADDEVRPASLSAVVPGSLFDESHPNAAENKRTAAATQLAEADSVSDSTEPESHRDGFVWSDDMKEFYGRKNGLKVLDDALACLRKGEPFAAVATKFSDGPRAEQGGWQRPTRPESIVDDKTAAMLRQLAEGETSSVIETDHAFRVIRLVTRMPAGWVPFEEVEKTIRQHLDQERAQQALDVLASRATIESAFPLDNSWQRVPSPAGESAASESTAP